MLISIVRLSGLLYGARELDIKNRKFTLLKCSGTFSIKGIKNTHEIFLRLDVTTLDYDAYVHCAP